MENQELISHIRFSKLSIQPVSNSQVTTQPYFHLLFFFLLELNLNVGEKITYWKYARDLGHSI